MADFNPYMAFIQQIMGGGQGGQLRPEQQMRLEQDKQLVDYYMKKGDRGAALAIVSKGGGNSALLDKYVTQKYFNDDPGSYKEWINSSFYGGDKNTSYNPYTGQIVRNGQAMASPIQTNYMNYYKGAQFSPSGHPIQGSYGGNTMGQPGQPAANNPYAGMTTLYRDSTGMIHDPGDNPIPQTPATPGIPTGNPYNFNMRGGGSGNWQNKWAAKQQAKVPNPYVGPNVHQDTYTPGPTPDNKVPVGNTTNTLNNTDTNIVNNPGADRYGHGPGNDFHNWSQA